MKWSIGITSASRPTPTLERTVESIHRSGWMDTPIITSDDVNGCEWREGTSRSRCGRLSPQTDPGASPSIPKEARMALNPEPSLVAKALRYAKAIRKWIAAGRPGQRKTSPRSTGINAFPVENTIRCNRM